MLDRRDRFFLRQHTRNGKEAGLHDGIDAAAHAGFLGNRVAVDHIKFQLLIDDLLLHLARQLIPDPIGRERAVQQERRALIRVAQHVNAFQERELVASHEVRARDEIARFERFWTEAQVRGRNRTRLLRVIDEIALGKEIGVLADDLDRVLVRAHRAIGAETVEQRPHSLGVLG